MFYLLAYIIRGGINRHRQKDQNFHCNKELFHAPNKINIDKEQKKTVQSSTSSTHKNKKAKTHPHSQPVSAPPGKTRSSAPDGAPPHSTGTPAGTPPDSADRLFAKTAANPSNYLQKKKKNRHRNHPKLRSDRKQHNQKTKPIELRSHRAQEQSLPRQYWPLAYPTTAPVSSSSATPRPAQTTESPSTSISSDAPPECGGSGLERRCQKKWRLFGRPWIHAFPPF